MSSILREIVGWVMLAAVIIGGLSYASRAHDRDTATAARNAVREATLDSAIARFARQVPVTDTHVVIAKHFYERTHDSLTREIAAAPGDVVPKSTCLAALATDSTRCHAALDSANRSIVVRDSLIDSLRAKVRTFIPSPLPRWSLFASGFYEPSTKAMTGEASTSYRLAGPVSIAARTSLRYRRDSAATARLEAGLSYRFR